MAYSFKHTKVGYNSVILGECINIVNHIGIMPVVNMHCCLCKIHITDPFLNQYQAKPIYLPDNAIKELLVIFDSSFL